MNFFLSLNILLHTKVFVVQVVKNVYLCTRSIEFEFLLLISLVLKKKIIKNVNITCHYFLTK